jgi:hypothetical protein
MLKMAYKVPAEEFSEFVDHMLTYRAAWSEQAQSLSAEVMNHLRKVTPHGKGSGGDSLAKSWQAEFEYDEGVFVKRVLWRNVSSHAYVLDYLASGTRPHDIMGKPLLAFEWEKAGGKTVIVAHVHHPGTKPMRPTIEDSANALIDDRVADIREKIIDMINRAIGAK